TPKPRLQPAVSRNATKTRYVEEMNGSTLANNSRASGSGAWLSSYLLLSAIWGTSFLFIKIADRQLSPLQVALARIALGTATVLVVLLIRRERLPSEGRTWGHLAFLALVSNALPFSLIAYGETHISSVLAGLWNATT